MTNCICEKHKDELKSLSLQELNERIELENKAQDNLTELTRLIKEDPRVYQRVLGDSWPGEEKVISFFQGYAKRQQAIIDLLNEELETRV